MNDEVSKAVKRILDIVGQRANPLDKPKVPAGTFQVKGNMRDDRTFSQLAADKFSGFRANDLWLRFELWIYGRIDRTLSYETFFNRPEALNEMYAEAFGIDITFSAGAMHDIKRLKERKLLLGDVDVSKALQAREDEQKIKPR